MRCVQSSNETKKWGKESRECGNGGSEAGNVSCNKQTVDGPAEPEIRKQ